MAVLVKTCCCGCSLRTGVMILAILGLIGSAYSIYQAAHSVKVYKELEENADGHSQHLPFNKKHFLAIIRLSYASLAFRVISLLVNVLLLGSCCTGNERLAFPWLGWSIFELFFTLGVVIFYISIWNGIYFIVVVYSFIEALGEDPSGTSAGFSPPLTGGNQTQMAGGLPPYAVSQKGTV
ncbi:uncharacterized protein LOC111344738 isoform X2 [Stylophora pistillata]|uniref:uncharacterized protein LOC111344738 isoform X2 n=1 Tax=Stylophora pistillata TaxID=50429 RepID=UPI000C04C3D3|nr:uncharacterized protein LOC111344738 isoform X2 [Stylophora pistillata]